MAPDTPDESFEPIDWDDVSGRRRLMTRRTGAFCIMVSLLGCWFFYDYVIVPPGKPTIGQWNATALDWLFGLSLLVFVFYLLVPLVQNRRLTRRYWRQLRTNPLAVASLGYLCLFFLLGLFGPLIVGQPGATSTTIDQPPVGVSISTFAAGHCVGEVSNGMCHGTLRHPFGTTLGGVDVLTAVIAGMRVALELALIATMLLVPLATVVGTVAAYIGGWVDEILMRYVDIQQVIPAFFVYIIAQFLYGPSLLLLVVIFGLLNWGGTARLVRSETLQKRETGYVRAAKNTGADELHVIRQHLLPNVSNTVITAVTLQIPLLIIMEATLSYLGLGDTTVYSWGTLIALGMNRFPSFWWTATFPIVLLVCTTVSFSLFGDALRDVLDPQLQTDTEQP
jgi:peptide/nickel transport system permease protein